jgi:ABC-type Zn uptake system ZnuABC Zn-binding protein ZnuA
MIRGLRFFLLVTVCALASCDRTTAPPPMKPVHITSTVYPLAQIAQELGLDRVTTEWILEKPADLQSFVPSDRDREIVRTGELLLVGGSIDAWAVAGRDLQHERDILRMNVIVPMESVSASALWLNPESAYGLADVIYDRLQTRLPDDRDKLSPARDQFKQKIRDLQNEFLTPMQEVRGVKVGTLSPLFDALLVRYDLPAVRLLDVQPQQLTDAQFAEIRKTAAEKQLHWLVLDASLPDGLVQLIESRTGLKAVRLEVLGSSAPSSPVHSYVGICRYNLTQLARLK